MPRLRGRVRLPAWLPTGHSVPAEEWARRHRVISRLAWGHAAVLPLYGILRGHDPKHVVLEALVVVLFALGAERRSWGIQARSVMATLGLVTASAVLTHFSGGLIEMHFHFFVVVAVISLYQSWLPFIVALAFVVAHHGIGGQLAPTAVYNHASALNDAWRWALVHGAFILAESAACLVAWRLNEVALEDERATRLQMEKAHTDLAAAQALSSVGSWEWDSRSECVWWSEEMYRILGRTAADYVPTVTSFVDHVPAEDRERIGALIAGASRSSGVLDFECAVEPAHGGQRVVHVRGNLVLEEGDGSRRLLGTCQDITARKELEAEVEHRALHDALTGLGNRALFLDRLEHALSVHRRMGTSLALLYLDLDNFKTVNDNLGHSVGDEVLVRVGSRIRDGLRGSDTVARLGGDEFAVLLEDASADDATATADKLLALLREPLQVGEARLLVRASIGIALADDAADSGDLLRHADIAMYAAKRQGRSSHRVFSEHMHSSLTARLHLEAELSEAIEQEQLILHYQPLVDLQTGRVQGVEALVRWDHPVRGMLPPSEFIPVAEEVGLIGALGTWVLRRATRDARILQDAAGPLYVSVNVAAPQLHEDLGSTVVAALAAADVQPTTLLLEITETCVMTDDEVVIDQLTALRELGVRIAIDDFGTGYSSLAYLRDLPIDLLKIDRRFVQNITGGPEESALAHSIIRLGSVFGLRIVGEGIETAEQASVLRDLGCHSGQGYYYLRPTDLATVIASITSDAVTTL